MQASGVQAAKCDNMLCSFVNIYKMEGVGGLWRVSVYSGNDFPELSSPWDDLRGCLGVKNQLSNLSLNSLQITVSSIVVVLSNYLWKTWLAVIRKKVTEGLK